jgi:hypothetical protein
VDEFGLTVVWGARPDGPASRAADHTLQMIGGRLEGA